jgi:hypothetical protein
VGIALGKEVYSDFPMEELRRMCPIQNGGRSAASIAEVCTEVLHERGLMLPERRSYHLREAV